MSKEEIMKNAMDDFQKVQRRMLLVQHCINNRVICTRLFRQGCVVVSQQWNHIASFLRLVLTKKSGTYYSIINAMLY